MKTQKSKTWQHKITGVDGDCQLFGVNIFNYKWNSTGNKAKVKDPLYGQDYTFLIYSVIIDEEEHEFAAGEFSNCIWGFFV